MKLFLYRLQNFFLSLIIFCLTHLPVRMASWAGGIFCRLIGPYLSLSKIADRNLQIAFPNRDPPWRKKTISDAWDNIGRTFAEFPHLREFRPNHSSGPGWHVIGENHLRDAYDSKRPVIFFSGHIGNWELLPVIVARYGLGFSPFYRSPNNPFLDRTLCALRQKAVGHAVEMFPKGANGARQAVRHLVKGGHLGVLGDQKMNDGIEVMLFNRPTMTAPAAAALAIRYNALIVTGHIWREGPMHFVLQVDPPLDPSLTLSVLPHRTQHDAVQALTQDLNNRLQLWIEKHPSQWLWFHRRWGKELYKHQKVSSTKN
ncbi:lysophospholipid acyltransferase family protein [Acetobacteraceae bacterium ESL0709]|nr:lysophospholipid acyltransferase family protein [Acetobacteraceae bacterium ESL0697]MDF7678243.1 lysophospholipid acyltransferase family protein [Acetobacteraceae bacterium ESL0709]